MITAECKVRVYYKIHNTITNTDSNIKLKNWEFLDVTTMTSSSENEYIDFEFKTDILDGFNQFMIKLILESKNSGFIPKVKDLRVIALTD